MEDTPKSKRRTKLRRKKVLEDDKLSSKEIESPKQTTPKAHSTPLDTKKAESTSGSLECEDEFEDKYIDDSLVALDSWNPCRVVWDYEAEADYIKLPPDKKLAPDRVPKTRTTLVHRKLPAQECNEKMMVEPVMSPLTKRRLKKKSDAQRKLNMNDGHTLYKKYSPRRKYNLKKLQELQASSTNDLLNILSVELQTLQKVEVQSTSITQANSHSETPISRICDVISNNEDTEANSINNISNNNPVTVKKFEERDEDSNVVQPVRNCDTVNYECKEASETFSALFDEDDDICIVQCTQEIEEKLNKGGHVDHVEKLESELVDKIRTEIESRKLRSSNSRLNRNSPLHSKYNSKNVDTETKNSKSVRNSPFRLSTKRSPFRLKHNVKDFELNGKSDIGSTKHYVQIKSVTPKRSNRNSARGFRNDNINCNGDNVFDDSFDTVIKNFTEDDIVKLSQGITVEKDIVSSPFTKSASKSESNFVCEHGDTGYSTSVNQIYMDRQCKNSIQKIGLDVNSSNNMKKRTEFEQNTSHRNCGNSNLSSYQNTVTSAHKKLINKGQGNEQKLISKANTITVAAELRSSTVVDTPPSSEVKSPRKCSQEEIEKKKFEARKRLERKKLSEISGKDKTSGNYSKDEETHMKSKFFIEGKEPSVLKCIPYNDRQKKVSPDSFFNISEIERKRQIAKMKLEKSRALDIKKNCFKH